MIRVEHFTDGVTPAYTISRETQASPRDGLIGILHAHEATDLIHELWPLLSRLEKAAVLEGIVPDDYCNNGDHPEK